MTSAAVAVAAAVNAGVEVDLAQVDFETTCSW